MFILKLGGSVITMKDKLMTADNGNIKRLCEEIKAAWPIPLVIVHGGGSFGHPIAEKYGLNEGFNSSPQITGFARTHQAMVVLNSLVVEALLKVGVPAVSVAPSSFIMTDDGRIKKADFWIIGQLVVKGFVPVLFGDVVLDKTKSFCVLSGDQLAVRLALELGATHLIFGVDVDGVFTDGTVLITTDGELLRKMNIQDGYAVKTALKKGYRVCIITGGSNEGVRKRIKGRATFFSEVRIISPLSPSATSWPVSGSTTSTRM